MKKIVILVLLVATAVFVATGCPSSEEGPGGEVVEEGGGNDWRILKTGQTDSYATGDDGDLQMGAGWPVPRFTDNGDGTVTDNFTGLMWEKSPSTVQKDWSTALTYANDSTLAGHNDWRLPNRNEIMTLHNFAEYRNDTWLNGQGFANMQFDYYWTSTTLGGDSARAAIFYLGSRGAAFWANTKNSDPRYAVICRGSSDHIMRTGQTVSYATGDDGDLQTGVVWPDPRFTDNDDGTVTDNLTGLMWEQNLDTTEKNFNAALTYVNDSTLAGHDDWRLPNYYELATLFDADETDQYLWLNAQGFSNVLPGFYWCSTYAPILTPNFILFLMSNDTNSMVASSPPEDTASKRSLIVRSTAQ